jgi:hypothetical protein
MPAHKAPFDLFRAPTAKDPGDANTILTDRSPCVVPLVSAGAETRTLGRPEYPGAIALLYMATDGGDITLTITGGINLDAVTTFTFSAVGQFLLLMAVKHGTTLRWQKIADYESANATTAVLGELADLTATAAEINRATDLSARIINTTATELAVTLASHSDKIVVVDSSSPIAVTFPAASGTGAKYTFLINTAATATGHTFTLGTLDVYKGAAHVASTSTDKVDSFLTTATDDKLTLNGTTKGGISGDRIEIIDSKLSVYQITAWLCGSGTIETGFTAT